MQDIKSVYRPPVEENTPILNVTTGCSHNRCKFCGMYKGRSFKVIDLECVKAELMIIADKYPDASRLFLSSGDAFALEYKRLKNISDIIRVQMPEVKTIATFSSISNISEKTDEELAELRKMGFNEITIGIESGWDDVLRRMDKGHLSVNIIEQSKRLDAADIKYFFSIIAGIAGHMLGGENASITAEILNRTAPARVDVAGLTVFSNSDLIDMVKAGAFQESTEYEMVKEVILLVEKLSIETFFDATHCTVPVRVAGQLPMEKERILKELHLGLEGFNERRLRRRRERYMKLRR